MLSQKTFKVKKIRPMKFGGIQLQYMHAYTHTHTHTHCSADHVACMFDRNLGSIGLIPYNNYYTCVFTVL